MPTVKLRVTDLDSWEAFVRPEIEAFELTLEQILARLNRQDSESDEMRAGTAFHKLLENARAGDVLDGGLEGIALDGWVFHFDGDFQVQLPWHREELVEREIQTPYGMVLLRGKTDGSGGLEAVDHKLTFGQFDAERYADSWQWRAYLTMLGVKRFRYLVYQARKLTDEHVWIYAVHELTFWAYPEMEGQVKRQVTELAEFVVKNVPTLIVP